MKFRWFVGRAVKSNQHKCTGQSSGWRQRVRLSQIWRLWTSSWYSKSLQKCQSKFANPRRSVLLRLHIQFQVSGHKSLLIRVTLICNTYSFHCLFHRLEHLGSRLWIGIILQQDFIKTIPKKSYIGEISWLLCHMLLSVTYILQYAN